MIIASIRDHELRLVTQNDHAHFAAELLSLWRRDGLGAHPRRRDILLAAREHDNGWREADSAPHRDPGSGRPYDFTTLPQKLRQQIWHCGVGRLLDREPYAALLITRHAIQLHRGQRDPAWVELVAGWRRLRDELMDECGIDREALESDYRLLELADLVSLALAGRWRRSWERHGYRGDVDRDTLRLSPFPLAGATTFQVPCRRVPDRRFAGDADLGTELATARWREQAVRVVPFES